MLSPRALARNLNLLARTGARHAADDPALLAVQTLRRLPARLRAGIASRLVRADGSVSVWAGLGHYLADRPKEARQELAVARPAGRVASRVAAELSVSLGGPAPADAPATVRARAAWYRGDITRAVTIARASRAPAGNRYAAVLASERDLLTPGFHIQPHRLSTMARRDGRTVPGRPEPDGIRPLHLLTNSLPWTQSGYSLRSHAILHHQAREGMAVEALTRAGYPVTVGLPHAQDVDRVDGILYRRVLPGRLGDTPVARLEQTSAALVAAGRSHRATLLHTTTHYPNAVAARAAAAVLGVPWVYEVRGQLEKTWVATRPPEEQASATQSERFTLARAREAELAALADHVVTLSRTLRDDLVSRGVPSERITLVPNAVDDHLLSLSREQPLQPRDARRDLGLPEEGFWVGSVSSLVDYEGLDDLITAVSLLRREGLDVRSAIVGDGVSRPALERLAASLGVADSVILPGRVPPSAAVQWHRALDLFAVPRRDTEVTRTVTPLKPIEAMALGRPVVASDLPALAEVIGVPGSGLLCAPGSPEDLASKIRQLLGDADLRDWLSASGTAFAQTRTWKAQARTYRRIYEGLGGTR